MTEYPNTNRHTPLPWKFDNNGGCKAIKGGKWNGQKQAQYKIIADTSGVGGVGDSGEREDQANAALMANAPRLLVMTRILAAYECAGVGQDSDDSTLCGQCGPCEANALLKEIERQATVPRKRLEASHSGAPQ